MKILKKIGLVLLVAFVIAQFFRPDKNSGDPDSVNAFLAETKPPTEVKAVLKTACFDCHSDNTTYPWYNNITPVNFWLAEHINDGKKHFDVSKWNDYSLKKKDHKIEELIEFVERGEMPLNSYTWTHAEARLSEAQVEAMINWAKSVRSSYALQMAAPIK
ncbi:heme-binding domain-containing protein [Winogradskyella maritima]|uniref:Heme-binding domain-containing protein n=1 Tax=Winogradskyella maritima TaxID=1517766 RepID=A0ABV8AH56_9FLAO|nr:heme-binding domain-containing protein [Winogradskyella maritima]